MTGSADHASEEMGPFTGQPELDDLASRMFRQFSRFEYALKATGHHPDNGDADADWTGFSEEIDETFGRRIEDDVGLREAVEYFATKPPNKQKVKGGTLIWDKAPVGGKNLTDRLLLLVRRVRNNLFHGGKYSGGGWDDADRTVALVEHSLVILDECLKLSDRVRIAYEH